VRACVSNKNQCDEIGDRLHENARARSARYVCACVRVFGRLSQSISISYIYSSLRRSNDVDLGAGVIFKYPAALFDDAEFPVTAANRLYRLEALDP